MSKQQEILKKLKNYAIFSRSGNNSYRTKKDNATITIHTNGNVQVQGQNKEKVEQEINEIFRKRKNM